MRVPHDLWGSHHRVNLQTRGREIERRRREIEKSSLNTSIPLFMQTFCNNNTFEKPPKDDLINTLKSLFEMAEKSFQSKPNRKDIFTPKLPATWATVKDLSRVWDILPRVRDLKHTSAWSPPLLQLTF